MILVALAVVASVAIGAAVERRHGDRARRASRGVLDLLLYGLVPFVAFFNVARVEVTVGFGAGLALGYVSLAAVGLAAWMLARRLWDLDGPATGALVCAAVLANTGFLGLPVTATLLGADDLGAAVAYDALVSAPVLLLGGFAIGAALGHRAGSGPRARARAFLVRNPPLLAVAAALLAPDALAPQALVDASRVVVVALLPLGFFALGVNLASGAEHGRLRVPPALRGPLAAAVGLRLVAAPALMAGAALVLVDMPDAYLLQSAMPSGINSLLVAHAYGLDVRLASATVAWSTALVLVAALVAAAAGAAPGA